MFTPVGMGGRLGQSTFHRARRAFPAPVVLLTLLLVALESSLFVRAMHQGTGGRWILPIDDAYIHQQYAVQAARGHPFQYDDQAPPTSGATSLLYPLVLAVAWRMGLHGDSLSAFAFLFGAVCLYASALMTARVGQRLYGRLGCGRERIRPWWVGLLAALLVLTNGGLLWGAFSGMEGALFILLLLATLDSYLLHDVPKAATFAALLALTRPEGLILAGLLMLVAAIRALWNRGGAPAWSWLYVLPLVVGLVQPLLNLALTGTLTASGMRAKSWLYNVPIYPLPLLKSMGATAARIWSLFLTGVEPELVRRVPGCLLGCPSGVFLSMPPLLGAIGVLYLSLQALREWRRRCAGWPTLLILWITGGLCSAAVMGTALWHFYRYLLPFFVLGLLAGAIALGRLADRLGGERGATALFAVFGLLTLWVSATTLQGWAWRYREATSTILNQQVRLGEWIREHLPAGATVGVHDVGAVRYYGGRATYDLVGLTEAPEASLAWRHGSGSIYEAMERSTRCPDYFAIYDDVYALPFFTRTDLFGREVFRVEHRDLANVASASDHQVVYAADWRLRGSGDCLYQRDVLKAIQGLRLVDWLDVADLRDERAHHYRWWQAQPKAGFPSDVFQLTYRAPPHQEVLDGGRLLTGGESFELKTIASEPMLLVGRFLGQSPVSLSVRVNGQPAGNWGYGALPGLWQERTLKIPAAYITSSKTRIEVVVDSSRPDLEFHRPFYYWCYQGEMPEEGPEVAYPLNANVGDGLILLGYSLEIRRAASACQLDLDLYWQASKAIAGDYKVFVHWCDGGDTILTQQDNRPAYDLQPTWLWHPGEVIEDHYSLALPLDPPPEDTVVYVGMYDPATGTRLPIAGGDPANRLELARFRSPLDAW